MKSARHKRLLAKAKKLNPLMTVDDINRERSFGAKKFARKKTRREMAEKSRKINRAV